jgi:hypothetical protein
MLVDIIARDCILLSTLFFVVKYMGCGPYIATITFTAASLAGRYIVPFRINILNEQCFDSDKYILETTIIYHILTFYIIIDILLRKYGSFNIAIMVLIVGSILTNTMYNFR